MRALAFASLSLVIGSLTLVGCNHGTNVPALHRPRPAPTPPAPTKPQPVAQPAAEKPEVETPKAETPKIDQPESRPAPAAKVSPPKEEPVSKTAPAHEPEPVAAPSIRPFGIVEGPWCHLSSAAEGYLVTRWSFTKGADPRMINDQLVIRKDQPTKLTMISTGGRWEQLSRDQRTPARARTGVEMIDIAKVRSEPAFEEQNDLMLELIASNGNVDHSDVSEIGIRGALRITNHDMLRNLPEIVAFPCADYSPDFATVGTPPAAAPARPTPPVQSEKPKDAPKADPMDKVRTSALAAPFTPFEIKTAGLEGSRWCSWTKTDADVVIGVLQFHAGQKMSLTQFFKSKLEGDVLDVLGLVSAVRGAVQTMSITGVTGSRFVTNAGRGFRLIDDANETRVLIGDDNAAPAAAPAPNAEVFYPCVPALIPGKTPLLQHNLKNYMDLRDKRARE